MSLLRFKQISGSILTTASLVGSNTISFTKGDGTTFNLVLVGGGFGGSGADNIEIVNNTQIQLSSASVLIGNPITVPFASFSFTASFATSSATASYITGAGVFGPFGSNSVISASYAVTAGYFDIGNAPISSVTFWGTNTTITGSNKFFWYQHPITSGWYGVTIGSGSAVGSDTRLKLTSRFEEDSNADLVIETPYNQRIIFSNPTSSIKWYISSDAQPLGPNARDNFTIGTDSNPANAIFEIQRSGSVGLSIPRVRISGSLVVSGSVFFPRLTTQSQANVVTIDSATGQLFYTASSALGGGGGTYTVNNGLTASTATNFQLGGPLVRNTAITGSTYQLLATSEDIEALYLRSEHTTTNDIKPVLNIERNVLNNDAADNIGASIEFNTEAKPGISSIGAGSDLILASVATDATKGLLRKTQFEVWTKSGTTTNRRLIVSKKYSLLDSETVEISASSGIVFTNYGSNNYGGTPTYALGVDIQGNVIEFSTSSAATTSPGTPEQAIQFNSASTFSGSANFLYNYINNSVILTGSFFLTGSTQSGGSGHILTYNTQSGQIFFTASSTVGGTSTFPGGPEQAIQFNSASTFSGSGNLKYDYANSNVLLTGSLLVTQSHISTVDYIDYTLNPGTLPHLEGRTHWDEDRKTLQIDTDVNNFAISAGHVAVLRGRNTNSYTLTKGTVVYISGNSGQFATFTSASWENDINSAYTIGIIAQNINANQYGYAVTDGEITGVNTNGFAPATLLYLSSSGQYTDVKPTAPNHTVRLGQVVVAATNGILQVKVDNGYELGELHDVLDSTTTSSYGDLLVKSGSLWINSKQLTGSYSLTGSLNISGSVINKGSTTLSGSVFISGSTLNPGSGHVVTYNTQSGQLFFTASSALGLPQGTSGQILQIDTANEYQLQTFINDVAGTPSIDFDSRKLSDVSGNESIHYHTRVLSDSTPLPSVDYGFRNLIYPDGITPAISYGIQDVVDITGSVRVTGSLTVSGSSTFTNIGPTVLSGSVYISGSTQSQGSGHVLTYDTASGQIFFTASSTIGGSGGVTQIVAGTNISIDPTGGTGVVTINSSGGSADVTNLKSGSFGVTVDGQGSQVSTGDAGYILIPYNCTMSGWFIFADQVGSIGIDLRKDTYDTFPAVQGDSICPGGSFPTITSAQKNSGSASSWSPTTLNAGDIINFNVTSSSAITRANLIVTVIKS